MEQTMTSVIPYTVTTSIKIWEGTFIYWYGGLQKGYHFMNTIMRTKEL